MFHSVSMPARPGEWPACCHPSRPSHASHASRSCSSCSFRLGASGVAVMTVLQRFEMRWQRRRLGIRWLRCAPTEVATRDLAFGSGAGKKRCAVRIFFIVFFLNFWKVGTMQRQPQETCQPTDITALDVSIFLNKKGL